MIKFCMKGELYMFSILCSAIILIIMRLIMSFSKLGFWGNTLAYAGLSTVMSLFVDGLSMGYFLPIFIMHFIFGLPLIYILSIIDDRGDWKAFVIYGTIIKFVLELLVSWILELFI